MTVIETVLVFGAVPLAVAGALALAVFGIGAGERRAPRYRPGRPFTFAPVWFVSSPRPGRSAADNDHGAGARPQLTAAARPATKKGGARGTW